MCVCVCYVCVCVMERVCVLKVVVIGVVVMIGRSLGSTFNGHCLTPSVLPPLSALQHSRLQNQANTPTTPTPTHTYVCDRSHVLYTVHTLTCKHIEYVLTHTLTLNPTTHTHTH